MEYYKDSLWMGCLVFCLSAVGIGLYQHHKKKKSQDYNGFFIMSLLIGFWLILSSLQKRRLVINHNKKCYQFFIRDRMWEEGPLHHVYVRLTAQKDARGTLYYRLIINGFHLEKLKLANLSPKYEKMASLGRRVARKLNLNYFDFMEVSAQHVIRHRPPPEEQSAPHREPV